VHFLYPWLIYLIECCCTILKINFDLNENNDHNGTCHFRHSFHPHPAMCDALIMLIVVYIMVKVKKYQLLFRRILSTQMIAYFFIILR
jgi:hypothetical protein